MVVPLHRNSLIPLSDINSPCACHKVCIGCLQVSIAVLHKYCCSLLYLSMAVVQKMYSSRLVLRKSARLWTESLGRRCNLRVLVLLFMLRRIRGSTLRRFWTELFYWSRFMTVLGQSAWLCLTSPKAEAGEALRPQHFSVVFVPGLMCAGRNYPAALLGKGAVVAQLSPYASSHDRAVELFYTLKGGRADYGEEHSCRFGHARFGRCFDGQLQKWDAENPIVLLAHSHGGNTARMLQHLLCTGFFTGYATSAAWVKAIICVAVPLNGCPVLHCLGMPLRANCGKGCMANGIEHGQAVGGVLSLVRFGQTVGYLLNWTFGDFDCIRWLHDWGLDHWSITRRTGGWLPLWQLLWGSHHILNTDDTAGYDLTVDGASRLNSLAVLHPCTYYFSLPCSWTTNNYVAGNRPMPLPTSNMAMLPFGALTATLVCRAIPTSFVLEWHPEEWLRSDLVVPLRSQEYPCEGSVGNAVLKRHVRFPHHEKGGLSTGVWHVLPTTEIDHGKAMFFPEPLRSMVQQILNAMS